MTNNSIRAAGSAEWSGAPTGERPHNRNKTALATISPQRAADGRSAPRGGWLVNRLLCFVMGHRQLVPTGVARILPNGKRREMFLCHACDGFTWKTAGETTTSTWSEVGV
jgi:hypothetical protein